MAKIFFTLSRIFITRGIASARRMAYVSETISRVVEVRSLEGEEKFDLVFEDPEGHHHSLLRDKGEHVSRTLKRIVLSSTKSKRVKTGERKHRRVEFQSGGTTPVAVPPLEAHLFTPMGEPVEDNVPNIDAWVEGSVLEVGSISYKVEVNIPKVLSLKLPKFARTMSPIVPEVELEFTDFYSCKWKWLRYPGPGNTAPDHTSLEVLGTSFTYWPSDLDAGHVLLVECTPMASDGRTGRPVTTLSPSVTESPKVTPITKRHLLTPARLSQLDVFRMVTYNTLAGVFTSSDYAHNVLYPYCDPTALGIEYRQGLLVHELIGYNADILSLQEVGVATYNKFLLPAFKDKGYEGCYRRKSINIDDGEAIFFDSSKFSLVAEESTSISEFFENDPSCQELYEGLKLAPSFLEEVRKRHSIILTVLLRSVESSDKYLLVANTHLYYHPKGDHIRLVQTAVMVNYLKTRIEKFSRFLGDSAKIAIVIGGDLNTCPCIAAYDYLVNGSIGKEHRDWMVYRMKNIPKCHCYLEHSLEEGVNEAGIFPPHIQCKLDQEGATDSDPLPTNDPLPANDPLPTNEEQGTFQGLELHHDFHFHNVTGTDSCTNFTANFKAVLDYIIIDSDYLRVERVVPLPPLSEVSEFVALPSIFFPSDHLALIADLKWKDMTH